MNSGNENSNTASPGIVGEYVQKAKSDLLSQKVIAETTTPPPSTDVKSVRVGGLDESSPQRFQVEIDVSKEAQRSVTRRINERLARAGWQR